MRDDGRLALAKAIPILEVADRLGIEGLKPAGGERVGPCPVCGGKDRFGINPQLGVFVCRLCTGAGGDGLALVQHVLACDFRAALAYLAGDADVQVDPAEMARRIEKARASEQRRADTAATLRARSVAEGRGIWHAAQEAAGSPVDAYLAGRGIRFGYFPPTLRYIAAHPYRKHADGAQRVMHTGPAMIAAIQDAHGHITAVHQTWINPDLPGEKAEIFWDGAAMPAKMVRGSKKGGAIRLTPMGKTGVMVAGEGLETTATAVTFDVVPGAAYWALVDLGNMSGRQIKVPGTRDSGLPDLADDRAWIPPADVSRLVFIQDGDSAAGPTRAKLMAGIRRAQSVRPGLVGQIVHPGAGVDLNDLARKIEIENKGAAQ
jgi:hypothetical protein